MSGECETFWDAVKGVAIIAVILIHTTSHNSLGGVVWRQFINFPVALFFFMAGYFCHAKESYGVFVARKAKRLLVPLGVAALVYGTIELYFANHVGQTLTAARIGSAFLSFPLAWGYFVLALFQCMVLAPFLTRHIRARWMLPMSVVAYSATALYFYLASTVFMGGWTLSHSIPIIFCTAWLPLIVLGIRLQNRRLTVWTPGIRPYAVLSLLLVWAVAGGIYWHGAATIQLARSQLRLPCILFALVLAGLLPNLADRYYLRGRIWSVLARLGEMSFFVYLWHRLALIALRSILPQFIEWHFAFAIILFAVLALVLPRSMAKRLWCLGV